MNVGSGVVQGFLGQRATGPVGAGHALVDFDAQSRLDQTGVAHLVADAEQGGGDLGIEQGFEAGAGELDENFVVLVGRVHDLDRVAALQALPQWREVQFQCIKQPVVAAITHLHETELGAIGALALEFGVHRQP